MACSAVLQELRKAVTEQQPASTMTALVQRLQEALVQTGDPAEAIGSLFAHLEAVKAVSGAVQVVAAFLRAQTANGATNTTAQLLLGILGQPLAAPVQNTSTGAGESTTATSTDHDIGGDDGDESARLVVVWDIERCTISSEYECASVIDSLRKQVDKNDDISDFKIKVFVRKEAPVSSALLEQLHGENATLIIVPSSKANACEEDIKKELRQIEEDAVQTGRKTIVVLVSGDKDYRRELGNLQTGQYFTVLVVLRRSANITLSNPTQDVLYWEDILEDTERPAKKEPSAPPSLGKEFPKAKIPLPRDFQLLESQKASIVEMAATQHCQLDFSKLQSDNVLYVCGHGPLLGKLRATITAFLGVPTVVSPVKVGKYNSSATSTPTKKDRATPHTPLRPDQPPAKIEVGTSFDDDSLKTAITSVAGEYNCTTDYTSIPVNGKLQIFGSPQVLGKVKRQVLDLLATPIPKTTKQPGPTTASLKPTPSPKEHRVPETFVLVPLTFFVDGKNEGLKSDVFRAAAQYKCFAEVGKVSRKIILHGPYPDLNKCKKDVIALVKAEQDLVLAEAPSSLAPASPVLPAKTGKPVLAKAFKLNVNDIADSLASVKLTSPLNNNKKTVVCLHFKKGKCTFGSKCNFLHPGVDSVQPQTSVLAQQHKPATQPADAQRLFEAVVSNDRDAVEQVLSRGVSINSPLQDGSNRTVLHVAVQSGDRPMVDFLLSKVNININSLTNLSETPLHYAAFHNYAHLFNFLVAKGADRSVQDSKGLTAEQYYAAVSK